MLGNYIYIIFHDFLSSADFFQNDIFRKILSDTLSECQTEQIQARSDILLGLIWVQTVCKYYQQTTKFDTGRQNVSNSNLKLMGESSKFSKP